MTVLFGPFDPTATLLPRLCSILLPGLTPGCETGCRRWLVLPVETAFEQRHRHGLRLSMLVLDVFCCAKHSSCSVLPLGHAAHCIKDPTGGVWCVMYSYLIRCILAMCHHSIESALSGINKATRLTSVRSADQASPHLPLSASINNPELQSKHQCYSDTHQ